MNVRNEIKAQIVRAGFTMQDVVDRLSDEYGWSDSVSNLSAKLQRESIRYKEVMELADVLGYGVVTSSISLVSAQSAKARSFRCSSFSHKVFDFVGALITWQKRRDR